MKIIRPIVVTDAMFTSSNLAETDYSAWSSATNYAVGARVIVVATHRIYESLVTPNSNNYPPSTIESEVAAGGTVYWKLICATNKWRAFDQAVGCQAEDATQLYYELDFGVVVDAVSLQNLDATQYNVTMTDPTDGEVYNETISLVNSENIFDWYDYFFEPILRSDADVIFDLPSYPAATTELTITNGSSTVKCGEVVFGNQRNLGNTIVRPRVGITDYSRKSFNDDSGELTVEERAFSKTMSCSVRINNSEFDDIVRILSLYRATAMVWVAQEEFSSMNIFGFYRDFQVELQYLTKSMCSLEIEGLT